MFSFLFCSIPFYKTGQFKFFSSMQQEKRKEEGFAHEMVIKQK